MRFVTLALALALSSTGSTPGALEPTAQESIRDLAIDDAIRDLELSIEPLETEVSRADRTTVTIASDVLFDFGRAGLTEVATRRLGLLAERVRSSSGVVRVEGHTDSIGGDAYNMRLSRQRAQQVKKALDRILGGTPRTVAVGYGETRPIAHNTKDGKDHPEGRAKNRRVSISFTVK